MAELLYKVADEVCVKVRENRVVPALTGDYTDIITLQIIAIHEDGYFVFIPTGINLQGSIYVDKSNAVRLDIPKRFLDSHINYINDDQIVRLYKRIEGCCCERCEEFFPMAEATRPNGKILCWACKQNPYR